MLSLEDMTAESSKRGSKGQHQASSTRGNDEGGSKRNIERRGSKTHTGGGGGKGLWSSVDDGSVGTVPLDIQDPNYDLDENTSYILVSDMLHSASDAQSAHEEGPAPSLSLSEFKQRLSTIFEEYFLSEDVEEVIRSLKELNSRCFHYEIIKRGISMSLDKKDHERELVSRLLSDCYPALLDSDEVGRGFQRLFEMIDDIQLDAPAARPLVASFLARAVADEILVPAFLRDPVIVRLGGEMVEGAKRLLSRDHVLSRLERVWGPGDGRSVPELKVAIDQLLDEYLLSRQLDEAAQCIKELNCQHFHHEVVKRAVQHALDKSESDCTAMSRLLSFLHSTEVISSAQMELGFDRLLEALPDLCLDAPTAGKLLDKFIDQGVQDGCLPDNFKSRATPGQLQPAE